MRQLRFLKNLRLTVWSHWEDEDISHTLWVKKGQLWPLGEVSEVSSGAIVELIPLGFTELQWDFFEIVEDRPLFMFDPQSPSVN